MTMWPTAWNLDGGIVLCRLHDVRVNLVCVLVWRERDHNVQNVASRMRSFVCQELDRFFRTELPTYSDIVGCFASLEDGSWCPVVVVRQFAASLLQKVSRIGISVPSKVLF